MFGDHARAHPVHHKASTHHEYRVERRHGVPNSVTRGEVNDLLLVSSVI